MHHHQHINVIGNRDNVRIQLLHGVQLLDLIQHRPLPRGRWLPRLRIDRVSAFQLQIADPTNRPLLGVGQTAQQLADVILQKLFLRRIKERNHLARVNRVRAHQSKVKRFAPRPRRHTRQPRRHRRIFLGRVGLRIDDLQRHLAAALARILLQHLLHALRIRLNHRLPARKIRRVIKLQLHRLNRTFCNRPATRRQRELLVLRHVNPRPAQHPPRDHIESDKRHKCQNNRKS